MMLVQNAKSFFFFVHFNITDMSAHARATQQTQQTHAYLFRFLIKNLIYVESYVCNADDGM